MKDCQLWHQYSKNGFVDSLLSDWQAVSRLNEVIRSASSYKRQTKSCFDWTESAARKKRIKRSVSRRPLEDIAIPVCFTLRLGSCLPCWHVPISDLSKRCDSSRPDIWSE
jgi:hypothetical protein